MRQGLPGLEVVVEKTVMVISMFLGVAAVAPIALTRLMIALGKVDV
jgi:hypothetical protein